MVKCLCKGDVDSVPPNVLDDRATGRSRCGFCPTRLKFSAHGADAVLCKSKTRSRKDEKVDAHKSVDASVQSRASTSSVEETSDFMLARALRGLSLRFVTMASKPW